MKRLHTIIIIIGLSGGCQTEVDNLEGHYISTRQLSSDTYETLDIEDSLVLINKASVFLGQRDTILIVKKTNSLISSTIAMLPIFELKVVNDIIEIHFKHDAGRDKIK